jgi:hypothetical protein
MGEMRNDLHARVRANLIIVDVNSSTFANEKAATGRPLVQGSQTED